MGSAAAVLLATAGTLSGCDGQDAASFEEEQVSQGLVSSTSAPVYVRAKSLTSVYGSTKLTSTVVTNAVRARLLTNASVAYRAAKVFDVSKTVTYSTQASFVVQLLETSTYRYENVLMTFDTNGNVVGITRNYNLGSNASWATGGQCPDTTVQAVFGTNCSGTGTCGPISSADAAVDEGCKLATEAGYKCKTMKGTEATVAAYQNWLSCPNVVAFGNVGHGNTTAIALEDGELNSDWFTAAAQKSKLTNDVVYFNSCQVHNSPLQPAIVGNASARTFLGGIHNLYIGSSEEVFKCFWTQAMRNNARMDETLVACEKSTNYPDIGGHGVSGNSMWSTFRKAVTLHRVALNCNGTRLAGTGSNEQVVSLSNGYTNYTCKSRYQNQCIDDGTFDGYYTEWCDYQTPQCRKLSTGLYACDPGTKPSFAAKPVKLHRTTFSCNGTQTGAEQVVDLTTGYSNYTCGNRFYEQCVEDGSWDGHYNEWCEYRAL
jgi:hypothetical protein